MWDLPEGSTVEPDSPASLSTEDQSQASTVHRRPRQRKIVFAVILFVLGIGLSLLTFLVVYPSEGEITPPQYSGIDIYTAAPIEELDIDISQLTPNIAKVYVEVVAEDKADAGNITLELPVGTTFDCAGAHTTGHVTPEGGANICHNYPRRPQSDWVKTLDFSSHIAQDTFLVNARSFAVSFGGGIAYAAVPEVLLTLPGGGPVGRGPESVVLGIRVRIPNAAAYDWSSFPTRELTASTAVWEESLNLGDNAGRIAVGINHAQQSTDDNLTFIAGALIGIAGSALLTSGQEFFHAFDKE
jgi:hypothetical protein